jgi:radical SAM protein with 4Fe4S-binding SPASM domain
MNEHRKKTVPASSTACAYPWQQMIIDLTGEVVPCCFWSGYGNTGKPLGNTNANTVEEIWNGPEYQALRRANASGNLEGHPCHRCVAWQWGNGTYPPFSWPASYVQEEGFCYLGQIPEEFENALAAAGQKAELREDGKPLPYPDSLHDDIRKLGAGRYSVSGRSFYFSSLDNSDPCANGRSYELRAGALSLKLATLSADSLSGRNILKAHEEYQRGVEVMEAKPTMISLISTADCNIDCPACSQNTVRLMRVQHRAETVPDVLEHMPYLHQFIWHGGEPYLIKRFRDFIDGFKTEHNPNLTFGFTSNGTMLTAKELEKLKKFPRINASISVDSFNKATFERIRKGAKYETVINNLLRAVDIHNAPLFVMSSGMIVCKSNFLELADNVRFAIEHQIGLNLSPVVIYPVTEQLNVFQNFAEQTRGWQEVLDEAKEMVARAKAAGQRAVLRIDPSGMLDELQMIYDRAREMHATTAVVRVTVRDPFSSLQAMRRPGILIVNHDNTVASSYASIETGAGTYELHIPALEDARSWQVVHDLLEPMGVVASGQLARRPAPLSRPDGSVEAFEPVRVMVRRFSRLQRPEQNIGFANYGEATPQGLNVHDPEDIHRAYLALVDREQASGCGLAPKPRHERVRELMYHYAGRTYQIVRGLRP